jgi:hypothetical protein
MRQKPMNEPAVVIGDLAEWSTIASTFVLLPIIYTPTVTSKSWNLVFLMLLETKYANHLHEGEN